MTAHGRTDARTPAPAADAHKLLQACSRVALDTLARRTDTKKVDTRVLFEQSSDADKERLRGMQTRAALLGIGTSFATLRFAFPFRSRPVLNGLAAACAGTMVSVMDVAVTMPRVVLAMVEDPAHSHSKLTDDVLCPALREFEPCAQSVDCRSLLAAQRSGILLHCVDACRARTLRFEGGSEMAAPSHKNDFGEAVQNIDVVHVPGAGTEHDAVAGLVADPGGHKATNSWDAVRARQQVAKSSAYAIGSASPPDVHNDGGVPIDGSDSIEPALRPARKNAYGDDAMG